MINGSKRIRVNALLDDATTDSYINADVSAELGLQGSLQKISVHVLNGKTETFESKPVEFTLESLDGNVDIKMSAMTTDRVTGDLKVVDWDNNKHKWNHLQNIDFPKVGKCRQVDLLIGLDYLQLHRSYEDVCGNVGEPFARLTPLGWTCIGNVKKNDSVHHTGFAQTFYTYSPDSRLNALVEQFWELEEIKPRPQLLKSDEQIIGHVQDSIVRTDGRYEVSIPWKDGQPSLPNDFDMAFQRLISTEQKLSKYPSIDKAYELTVNEYHSGGTSNDVDVEKKSYKKTVRLVTVGISDSCWKLEPSRFSSWSKLERINAWVYRFLDNCVSPKGLRIKGDLKADVTDEELQTAFTGAEALINSRPLTYQTTHPQDETPLTPNHFLLGQIGGIFATDSLDETTYHPAKRWRRVQELVKHLWKRWMTKFEHQT